MNGAPSTSQLRIAASLRKIRAFLRQIEELKASDFPHKDGESALAAIEKRFQEWERRVRSLPPTSKSQFIDETFDGLTRIISRNTEILGFILRSTNVRNAFELYFPLKRIVQQILGNDVSLLISSEWKFVPFTFPMNLPELPNFVLVGGPAPESGNVLIVPLAGHEIGHSAWGKLDIKDRVRSQIFQEFWNFVQQNKDYIDDLAAQIDTATGGEGNLADFVLNCLLGKAEEVFCDLFGLYIFGASYVYAFEYLLAPGFGSRNHSYPPESQRIEILGQAASVYGINIAPEAFVGWRSPAATKTIEDEAIKVADRVLMTCASFLIDETRKLLTDRGITPIRNDDQTDAVRAVREAFSRGAPYGEGATLPEIVVAGWEYVREQGGLANPAEYGEHDMLQELMLKSVEVSEVITHRSEHRDRAV